MLKKNIIYLSLTLGMLAITPSINLAQTTYYVANTGNDANNGRSITEPFQSIAKINSISLRAGDSVLFRRGDTFRGTLTIRQSGSANQKIVFDAYGSGPKPVLSGSVPVSNWSNQGGNIWRSTCSSCNSQVTGLYRNGVSLPLGRWPNANDINKGNLTIRAHTNNYQIFSQEPFLPNIDWKGAEVVLRPTAWIIDRAVVDHQYGNDVLNLIYNSTYNLTDNTPFFFQNHPGTLDQNGEWFYDSASKSFLLYYVNANPNDQTLTATVFSRAIDMVNVSNISLRNLHLTQTLNTTLYANNVSNVAITNLDITNSGENGLQISGSGNNVAVENSNVLDVNNNGVDISPYQNVTFRNNTLRRIGTEAGRGKSGDGQYNGLQTASNLNVLIENNRIDSIGYNGITFTFGNNTTIRQNIISNYCISKIDGGGIYAWNGLKMPMSNIHLESNIIYASPNVRGKYLYDYSIGIFLDDCVENVEIKNNTIFGNTQWGIFLHGANKITITDNTLFDNYAAQLVVYHNNGNCPVRNDVIKRNVLVSKLSSQLVGQYESNANDLLQYGVIDSNYYARPFNEQGVIWGVVNATQAGSYNLNDWKNFSGQDRGSKGSPITYKQYKNDGAGGKTRFASTFETGTDVWTLLYSNYNNAQAVQDNTNKLDGGSLRVSFTTPSGRSNSYAQLVKYVGDLIKDKTYVLRFDAVASVDVNVLVYLRQHGPPYREYDKRYTVPLSTVRKSYELLFTPSDNNPDALVVVQIDGEGPIFWLDNIRLQEDVPIRNDPSDFIKLFYNPTQKDSVIALTDVYRDVKNKVYTNSVLLKPFTSVILLKDTLPVPPADLSLSMQTSKRVLYVNEPTSIQIRVRNQSTTQAGLARWTCRLPANLEFVVSQGQVYTDNVLTGTLQRLAPLTDTTFTIQVKPTSAGIFRVAAQLTTATSADPDSSPNSGTADGEDDAATVEFSVIGTNMPVFESPNPNQRSLPVVVSAQPTADPAKADLSLRIDVNRSVPAVGEIITYTLYVANAGGRTASLVYLENQLPDGLELVNTSGWAINERTMITSLGPIAPNTTASVSFSARLISPGDWINRAQISTSDVNDPDSTPGNGFLNGEDDEVQSAVRSQ